MNHENTRGDVLNGMVVLIRIVGRYKSMKEEEVEIRMVCLK